MKPRIVHIISELALGGAEKQLLLILPHLEQHFENHVICLIGQGEIGRQLEQLNIPVQYLNSHSRLDPSIIKKLYRSLQSLQPSAAIGYLLLADMYSRVASKQLGIPYISSQRSSYVGRPYLRLPDMLTAPLVTSFTAQTKYGASHISSRKKHIIPNAVELLPLTSHPPRHNSEYTTLTTIANFKPGKGHSTLLQAVSNLKFEIRNLKLLLAGNGPLRPQLEAHVKNLGLQNTVTFLGTVKDIPSLLQKTDIFILPTEGEGMSNALLEAMAAGLPCITTDIPANQEIIKSGHTGLLVPPNNPVALAAAISKLANDENYCRTLGTNARQYTAANHSPVAITKQWQQIISAHAK